MITLLFWQSNYNLFQKWKGLVDKLSFDKSFAFTSSFLSSLTTSQIHEINFTHDNFLRTFYLTSDFEVYGKNTVASGTISIEFMLCDSSIILSFKEHLKGFLFIFSRLFWEAFYDNIAFGVFLNVHLIFIIFIEEIT